MSSGLPLNLARRHGKEFDHKKCEVSRSVFSGFR